jgi:hypothetical protein
MRTATSLDMSSQEEPVLNKYSRCVRAV